MMKGDAAVYFGEGGSSDAVFQFFGDEFNRVN